MTDIFLTYARNILDFSIIFAFFFCVLYFTRGTRLPLLLLGLVIVAITFYGLAEFLNLQVLTWLLDKFWTIAPLALIIIFQTEIRRAFTSVGKSFWIAASEVEEKTIHEVVKAVEEMSSTHTGALIVFERKIGLAVLKNAATPLQATVCSELLKSIFYPKSPLHDGAVIIRGNIIESARVILPLTQTQEYSQFNIGTRHKAALGITEETDAVVLIVSEETGKISVAIQGVLDHGVTAEKLTEILQRELASQKLQDQALTNKKENEQ